MDQATSADRGVLRDLGQRREDEDLDRRDRFPARGDREETSSSAGEPPHDSADHGSEPVRENRYHSSG